ncbi:hypothetical protein ACNAUY_07850 [Acinetobacter tibetensis]|uniref:hypothetical protein n=1 Tax=Acinetobacter tibetensis TaxID=2943497 RepID=UPI003A4DAB64
MRFKEALEEARNNRAASVIGSSDSRTATAKVMVTVTRTTPVQINLSQDQAAATRVVRAAARRVITQHRDEIEALAYK